MGEKDMGARGMLAKPIQLADQVAALAGQSQSYRAECVELKNRADRMAALLRQAARADQLYDRPAARITDEAAQALAKAHGLASRCHDGNSVFRRVFALIPPTAFSRALELLDNSIEDLRWLLRISSADGDADGDGLIGMPNIAQNEPILPMIWQNIARLNGPSAAVSAADKAEAASSLAGFARGNKHYAKLIIEEEGVPPLLRLLKEGNDDGQEAAARAIGLLGSDGETVERIVKAGACSVLAAALKSPPMRVQAAAAEAIGLLADNHQGCQDLFAQANVIRQLVVHLSNDTIQEHVRYSIGGANSTSTLPKPSSAGAGSSSANPTLPPMNSLHSVVLAKTQSIRAAASGAPVTHESTNPHHRMSHMGSIVESAVAAKVSSNGNNGSASLGLRQRVSQSARVADNEDPATKARMKAMAAYSLWKLATGNVAICKSITESRALLCFAVLLEKGDAVVQYFSAMALMEIARVSEHNLGLRQSAFRPSSPAAKAVLEQLLRVVHKGEQDDELLRPCVTTLGCLARTFTASETRIIGPLVALLDEREPPVLKEAVIALTKFACTENHLHATHCRAIVDAGGAGHLVPIVYMPDEVQVEALVLLCYVAQHAPESEALAQAGVVSVLLWASKQTHLAQEPRVEPLLQKARERLELYQSRNSR